MTNVKSLKTCSVQEFYTTLRALHGITPINVHIARLLRDMQRDLKPDAEKVIYIYLSLLEDGNTRLALEPKKALAKWLAKWDTLVMNARTGLIRPDLDIDSAQTDFEDILNTGIEELASDQYDKIIETRESNIRTAKGGTTRPLVRAADRRDQIDYLYAARYFDAKCIIEEEARRVFSAETTVLEEEKAACQKAFRKLISDEQLRKGFALESRQLEAIIRGQNENLIITGGPGTGKTTVICFLLWKLLCENKAEDMSRWEIRLAAPSGKAADRMRESMLETLTMFKDSSSETYKKLRNLESGTLHRLLRYNPARNEFIYCEDNRFPEKTIFIIDEASMIDIDLFARFMQALPKTSFKLFILGDPDQLPSVDAGAVLGEMLRTGDFSVRLDVSKRFDRTSNIGRLAAAIQNAGSKWPESNCAKPAFTPFTGIDLAQTEENRDSVRYFSLSDDPKAAEKELEKLTSAWVSTFYKETHFISRARKIFVDESNRIVDESGKTADEGNLDALWAVTECARILSAERQGMTGTENINDIIKTKLGIPSSEPFFAGQLLMLTQNQPSFRLYNGDCGVVIGERNTGRLHLLLRKVRTQASGGESGPAIGYVTCPLSWLPAKALESAFAMTIHKSQGSGYKNVMIFLPKAENHPLLNRQMIYTGVTRTKMQSLTIVASQKSFEAGCRRIIERDTGIDISQND